eukprot:gnl/TRDRNA2_/TRDRNA2_36531_c0_seq1.p1 gnl/TRDRNA2_/TRDRNA2_36531_c0~~gnl/TRDRNA2_/TRDRNA2_36531_c0_seq1.p1  ORF type:complete len:436 (-),score=52.79 gnl/TRDRNA2_/TRDRNA2_36531_c0_seq1:243-1550(-)
MRSLQPLRLLQCHSLIWPSLIFMTILVPGTLARRKVVSSVAVRRDATMSVSKSIGGPGWGDEAITSYPNDDKQIKRAHSARSYWGYSKQPAATTFDTELDACRACITFYPEKQDGLKNHASIPQDVSGGAWAKTCHAGPCDLRDPQTQPWGGIVGAGSEAFQDAFGGWWKPPDNKQCITLDPVQWYKDCDPILRTGLATMYDISRYCSYTSQLSLPSPTPAFLSPFAGVSKPFTRLNPSREQCLGTIQKQGKALFDDTNVCDSNLKELSECCHSMHASLICLFNTAKETKIAFTDQEGYNQTKESLEESVELFTKYCEPLCMASSKGEFCKHFPRSDICVALDNCNVCTTHGAEWCEDSGGCHCPSSTVKCRHDTQTTPMSCIAGTQKPPLFSTSAAPPMVDFTPAGKKRSYDTSCGSLLTDSVCSWSLQEWTLS